MNFVVRTKTIPFACAQITPVALFTINYCSHWHTKFDELRCSHKDDSIRVCSDHASGSVYNQLLQPLAYQIR
jgi:hypothetical protein